MAYIEKRGEKSWRLVVDVGEKADGTRDRRYKTIKVEDKALLRTTKRLNDYLEDQLSAFKQDVLSGKYIKPEKITFKKFVDEHWRPKHASNPDVLAESTLVVYEQHMMTHILPYFGHMKLDEITPSHVSDFKHYLTTPEARKDGKPGTLGTGTQRFILRVLRHVFVYATEERRAIAENPMDGIRWPKKPRVSIEVYTESEIEEILGALYREPVLWRLLILGAFLGAFRRGELVALELNDLDFVANTIRIDENIPMKIGGKHLIKLPKNESSMRTIVMPGWYMKELEVYCKEWKRRRWEAGTKWKGGNRQFVFHTGYGVPYHPNRPTNWWREFLKKHGFRHVKLHGLRHTSATFLLEQGMPSRAVAERLGHQDEHTLNTTYSHVTKPMERRAAEKFDRFSPEKNAPNLPPNEKTEA
ncbi:tyrosine-type recombinase/integrase [Paenibacillus ehimensis]|uniref:tyrosine-type recombinase/integrase n=1 Tax=Paenibacillus ehimensis TaxID=79264 RepID=UPI000470ABAF|nr:site-specific integrase [Paenibacillus ehimensis]